MEELSAVHNRTASCGPRPTPAVGFFQVESGKDSMFGTVLRLQCPLKYRPLSGARLSCVLDSNNTLYWSGGTPECRPLSRFEDEGFRLALLLSFISIAIILIMSFIFITSCLVQHVKHQERRRMERERKSGRSEFWQDVEVQEVEREALHQQKNTNNNNNNNRQHMGRTTDSLIYNHGDLGHAYRYLQLYPQHLHPSPLMGAPLGPPAAGLSWDGCVWRPEPLWTGQSRAPMPVVTV